MLPKSLIVCVLPALDALKPKHIIYFVEQQRNYLTSPLADFFFYLTNFSCVIQKLALILREQNKKLQV